MSTTELIPISAEDVTPPSPLAEALLILNNDHAQELSWLAPEQLTQLVSQAFFSRRIGHVDAFLIAFDQEADYDSPNFLWFAGRHPRFVYIDRVVVAATARGRGLARRLYDALIAEAARAGHSRLVCEVNSDPANPGSDAFHAALGFVEVGSAAIHDGRKTVRYLARNLENQAAVAGGRASTE